jgi:leucyl-tRNA synthetase
MSDDNQAQTAAAPDAPDSSPAHRYTASLAGLIEERWQQAWHAQKAFRTPNPGDEDFSPGARRFYCLDMFPYPSGAGLHVGHPVGYTGSDIISRYRRMCGDNVLHPMGWDAFGLPAEQHAIATGVHPRETTTAAINTFRRQLQRFGFSYDWDREFATSDEDYYKWTQWIWLLAWSSWYDHRVERARPISELVAALESGEASIGRDGCVCWDMDEVSGQRWHDLSDSEQRSVIDGQRLAYLDEQTVNWCPNLGTVLANDEVIDGRSERGHHPIVRRPLKGWMFRITAFAERLLESLDDLNWPNSTLVKQRGRIGRSEGADIRFPISETGGVIDVFTTRPDTLFGVTFMVLAPEHPLVEQTLASPPKGCDAAAVRAYVEGAMGRSDIDRMSDIKEKTGHPLGIHAIHPATGDLLPIWVSDYVLMGYGHGAIMAVPGHDDRDNAFALNYGLPIIEVVKSTDDRGADACWGGDGVAVNSSCSELDINGLGTAEAKASVIHWAELGGHGHGRTNWGIHDWTFSRQRYWGEPFPIVRTEDGAHYPVSIDHLPVRLPNLDDYQPPVSDDPQPLLAKMKDWVETTAGAAGVDPELLAPETPVWREASTMPGSAGSCWYFVRFCDPTNQRAFAGEDATRYWLGPTDDSAGGVDLYVGGDEHTMGHLLYARFWTKLLHDLGYLSTDEPFRTVFHQGMLTSFAYKRADKSLVPITEVDEDRLIELATGEKVERVIAKMSKSLRNIINPDDVIAEYGADTFRLYEMYMGPLDASKPWNTRDIVGVFRFLQRAWRLVVDEETGSLSLRSDPDPEVERGLHRMIAKVGADIDKLAHNTAIAAMIEFVNLATQRGGLTSDQLDRFARALCPLAPHIAEELYARSGHEGLCSLAAWPDFDESMLHDQTIELPVQVKGKVKARITVPADAAESDIIDLATADDRIAEILGGDEPRKVIVVPGKIVNIIP